MLIDPLIDDMHLPPCPFCRISADILSAVQVRLGPPALKSKIVEWLDDIEDLIPDLFEDDTQYKGNSLLLVDLREIDPSVASASQPEASEAAPCPRAASASGCAADADGSTRRSTNNKELPLYCVPSSKSPNNGPTNIIINPSGIEKPASNLGINAVQSINVTIDHDDHLGTTVDFNTSFVGPECRLPGCAKQMHAAPTDAALVLQDLRGCCKWRHAAAYHASQSAFVPAGKPPSQCINPGMPLSKNKLR